MKPKSAALLDVITTDFAFERGRPLPFGSTVERGGVNFAIFSSYASSVTLLIYHPGEKDPIAEFPLDGRFNRTGNVWHAFLGGLDPGIEYAYRMTRRGEALLDGPLFASGNPLLDPYARSVSRYCFEGITEFRALLVDQRFDWGVDQPLNIPLADSIIYELHVAGYTKGPNSKTSAPGTFEGLRDKIPWLQSLGITAIELMPVSEFDEQNNKRYDPTTQKQLRNFWGYDPVGFFSPNGAYCLAQDVNGRVREFKETVKGFHAAGMEVILDVVFNHTGEGDAFGPTFSLRGIDKDVYYLHDPVTGENRNYSGCGNTLNCNHPVVRDLILDCLHYWVTEMHVDGFRFDLASILGRGRDGSVLANPPLLERIAADPVLAGIKLIAEAWDASGLYQLGSFAADKRWAEWNGKYRDDLRRYVRGDQGMVGSLAARLGGSADLFQPGGRAPFHSVNFITCHDGFTLADLVSYNEKHNEGNGENNRDGCGDNWSWNCGVEGPTANPEIQSLRRRQMKNMLALLLVSQGVPMLLSGDEMGNSQNGNNNAYCQDGELGWINWTDSDFSRELRRFASKLIAFRKEHRALRSRSYLQRPGETFVQLTWHGTQLGLPDWSYSSHSLALELTASLAGIELDHVYLITNAFWEPLRFKLPRATGGVWTRFLDTSIVSPGDVTEEGILINEKEPYTAGPRSVVVLAEVPGDRFRL